MESKQGKTRTKRAICIVLATMQCLLAAVAVGTARATPAAYAAAPYAQNANCVDLTRSNYKIRLSCTYRHQKGFIYRTNSIWPVTSWSGRSRAARQSPRRAAT